MIVTSLKVQNYKLLKDVEIEKLGKINLIVGKNNSGKSTVLECLRILASKGNPSVWFFRILLLSTRELTTVQKEEK